MDSFHRQREQLEASLRRLGSCAVAFSGGVDSAVVAYAAHRQLGQRAVAVTGISSSLSASERAGACDVAVHIGIRHIELATQELANPAYAANLGDRCFHCKSELYRQMHRHLADWGVTHLVNGTNADDLSDYRPGLQAAMDFEVVSPLADAGLGKSAVRELAAYWKLPVADKPASPCLASRIAYGQPVTRERLAQIERAEAWLTQEGFSDIRVRWHDGDLARLEVPIADLPRLCGEPLRTHVAVRLCELGFRFVTLDLQGRRSGSLNALLPLEQLERSAKPLVTDGNER